MKPTTKCRFYAHYAVTVHCIKLYKRINLQQQLHIFHNLLPHIMLSSHITRSPCWYITRDRKLKSAEGVACSDVMFISDFFKIYKLIPNLLWGTNT
jgi:hypothetical protein